MTARLAIFDFDGTLANTFPVFRDVFDTVIDRYALRRPQEADVHWLRTQPTSEILRWLGVPMWQLPAIMRFARSRMQARAEEITLFPGIDALLHGLVSAELRIAVVSSNAERTVRTVLGPALMSQVSALRCGVGLFGKASRLRGVLRRTGVTPDAAVFVGDEERDVAAARGAGVRAIAVTWGYAAAPALAHADLVCDRVDALATVLAEHARGGLR
jgi:phosphoglycolate phosphatase